MTAEERIRTRAVEWILYNYPEIRAQLSAIMPAENTGLLLLSFAQRGGSPVESVAIERAKLSIITDVVERTYRRLRRAERRLVRRWYFERIPPDDIADEWHTSRRTLYRLIERARGYFARALATVSKVDLEQFWKKIDALQEAEEEAKRRLVKGENRGVGFGLVTNANK